MQDDRQKTPTGWSDTDWIKHLDESDAHPLACLHINIGSMDSAADAYEKAYNDSKRGRKQLAIEE